LGTPLSAVISIYPLITIELLLIGSILCYNYIVKSNRHFVAKMRRRSGRFGVVMAVCWIAKISWRGLRSERAGFR
jgi:hypothetical protein